MVNVRHWPRPSRPSPSPYCSPPSYGPRTHRDRYTAVADPTYSTNGPKERAKYDKRARMRLLMLRNRCSRFEIRATVRDRDHRKTTTIENQRVSNLHTYEVGCQTDGLSSNVDTWAVRSPQPLGQGLHELRYDTTG